MIVLDTTVLVYTKGAAHPLRGRCRQLVEAIADRRLPATTTVEVIQEFAHVRARRCGRTDAAALPDDYAELLSSLLGVTHEQLHRGLSVFARAERLGAFDCVLAAAAAGIGARALVSADLAFAAVPDVAHVVPDSPGVRALLAT